MNSIVKKTFLCHFYTEFMSIFFTDTKKHYNKHTIITITISTTITTSTTTTTITTSTTPTTTTTTTTTNTTTTTTTTTTQLHEVDINKQLMSSDFNCDAVVLIYDINDYSSFEQCATTYLVSVPSPLSTLISSLSPPYPLISSLSPPPPLPI